MMSCTLLISSVLSVSLSFHPRLLSLSFPLATLLVQISRLLCLPFLSTAQLLFVLFRTDTQATSLSPPLSSHLVSQKLCQPCQCGLCDIFYMPTIHSLPAIPSGLHYFSSLYTIYYVHSPNFKNSLLLNNCSLFIQVYILLEN